MTKSNSQISAYRALARAMLGRSATLGDCVGETLDEFLARGKIERYRDGDILAMRGQPMEALLFVLTGSLEIGMVTNAGKRFVIRYLEPGQLQGIIPVIDGKDSIHDVRAHGEAVVLLIPRAVFVDAVGRDPALAQALLRLFCARSRARYDDAAFNALGALRTRVARTLLSLLPAYGLPRGDTVKISLRLSQDELASLVGVSRQRLNKELNDFESKGLISLSYSHIEVVDCTAMEAIASIDLMGEHPAESD